MIGSLRTNLRIGLATVAILATSACSGGGGGGGGSTPKLVRAVFSGAGPTPQAGDTLLLTFSESIALVSGTTLSDADLALAPAASLGAVTSSPTLLTSTVVSVPLGAGVSIVPGTTTIDIETTDAIQDLDGNLAEASTPITITTGDGDRPTIGSITINGVDSTLNGTGAAGGTLQVPQWGFTVDITYSDATSTLDQASITLSADVTVSTSGGNRVPNSDLAQFLSISSDTSSATLLVPQSTRFPEGAVTVTASIADSTGMVSIPVTFSFLVKPRTNDNRPFETNVNASQSWFIDMSRDIESYTVNVAQTEPVAVVAGSNGRADIEDLFRIIGLHSATPIANANGLLNSNQEVSAQFQAKMLEVLQRVYSGVNVDFTFTSPGAFPSSGTSVAYSASSFSQICVAGAESAAGNSGVLGIAIFDPFNDTQNNNCVTDFQGSQRLGVFMHTAVNEGIKDGLSPFRTTFDPFTTARGGTPIGDQAGDENRLLNPALDARAGEMETAIDSFATMTAIVLAHEAGHSMGLVTDGAMPVGLYGNLAAFPGSTSGHIRNTFPAGSTNIMNPSLSFSTTLSSSTAFNTLNQAYLRELIVQDR